MQCNGTDDKDVSNFEQRSKRSIDSIDPEVKWKSQKDFGKGNFSTFEIGEDRQKSVLFLFLPFTIVVKEDILLYDEGKRDIWEF